VNTSTPIPPADPYHLPTIYWTPPDMIINITSLKPNLTIKSNPIQLQAAQTYSKKKKKMFLEYTTNTKCTRLVATPQQIRNNFIARFQASAMVQLRSLLFCNVMQCGLEVGYICFSTAYRFQNVSNQVPPYLM
jgi:hypothetical protein